VTEAVLRSPLEEHAWIAAVAVVVACRKSVGRPNVGAAEAGLDTDAASGFGLLAVDAVVDVGTTPVLILLLGV
jgi:hypothetical protein